MYFEEVQIKSLGLMLRDFFPGAELVFDAFSPFIVRMNNFRFKISRVKISARYNWGLKRGNDLEGWGDGISLLDEWFPYDHPDFQMITLSRAWLILSGYVIFQRWPESWAFFITD